VNLLIGLDPSRLEYTVSVTSRIPAINAFRAIFYRKGEEQHKYFLQFFVVACYQAKMAEMRGRAEWCTKLEATRRCGGGHI